MIQPIRDNILLKPFESDNISDGGIIVPDSAKKRNNKALVVATGNGTRKRKMIFKKGDVVFNIKDAGDEIIEDGVKYFLVKDIDLLAFDN